MTADIGEVTRLLHDLRQGDRDAEDRLFGLVYEELRSMARRRLRGERAGHTLDPTALVHEAFLKLGGRDGRLPDDLQNRAHFLALAGRAMRQVLVDHARRKSSQKRGGDWQRETLTSEVMGADVSLDEFLALDAALTELEGVDARLRQVVEYRFFAGLGEDEIAALLGVTTRTVQRDWVKARAWLHKELYPRDGDTR